MKYIIDVPNQDYSYDKTLHTLKLKFYDDNLSCEVFLDAELYTEPDRKAIEDEVWKLARTIESMSVGEIMNIFDVREENVPFLCNTRTYQEAKAKFEAWLKQKDEIHVGDEVNPINDTWRGVVVNVDNGDLTIMGSRGISANGYESKYFSKTGRHFDEVEELLKKMRGDSDGTET